MDEQMSPRELREDLYKNAVAISYKGKPMTIDEANQVVMAYMVEGATDQVAELVGMISVAKNNIRAQIPDEDGTVTTLPQRQPLDARVGAVEEDTATLSEAVNILLGVE